MVESSSVGALEEKAEVVHLSFQTLLKIIQHATDVGIAGATGQLLGMGQGKVLEVTDMIPAAARATDDGDAEAYLMEMLKALRDVNVDHTMVGWYQAIGLDAALQASFLQAQLFYQSEIANSCFLIYDHLRSALGPHSVRAFRLTGRYMEVAKMSRPQPSHMADLLEGGLVVELPVRLWFSAMDNLILASIREEVPRPNPLGSEHAHRLVLETVTQNLVLVMDEAIAEAGRVQHYIRSVVKQQQAVAAQRQKRRAENAARKEAGEPTLPETDVQVNLKGISDPPRLPLLHAVSQLSSMLELSQEVIDGLKLKQSFSFDN